MARELAEAKIFHFKCKIYEMWNEDFGLSWINFSIEILTWKEKRSRKMKFFNENMLSFLYRQIFLQNTVYNMPPTGEKMYDYEIFHLVFSWASFYFVLKFFISRKFPHLAFRSFPSILDFFPRVCLSFCFRFWCVDYSASIYKMKWW